MIKFKPGEYDDTTEDGLKKIATKLGDAVKLKVANNGNQLDVSKAITEINIFSRGKGKREKINPLTFNPYPLPNRPQTKAHSSPHVGALNPFIKW